MQVSAQKNSAAGGCGEKGPGKVLDCQGCPPPSLRMVHPKKQEIKQIWQKT